MWQERWKDEYNLAVQTNSQTRTVVPAKKNDLRIWKGYLKVRNGQLHSMEIRLEYLAEIDKRTLFYPLVPPQIEWQTPIRHPNIQPPKPMGDGIVCLAPLDLHKPEFWNPKTHIFEVLNWVELLLNSPNPSDPINHPVCLETAITMIRQKTKGTNVAQLVEPKLRDAEKVIRKFAPRWKNVTLAEVRERDRAWFLVKDAGSLK